VDRIVRADKLMRSVRRRAARLCGRSRAPAALVPAQVDAGGLREASESTARHREHSSSRGPRFRRRIDGAAVRHRPTGAMADAEPQINGSSTHRSQDLAPFGLPDHAPTVDGVQLERREPRQLHVLLATTGSVASVKAPLIVQELLKVLACLQRRVAAGLTEPLWLVRGRAGPGRRHEAVAGLLRRQGARKGDRRPRQSVDRRRRVGRAWPGRRCLPTQGAC
jgi:hypothetical protein